MLYKCVFLIAISLKKLNRFLPKTSITPYCIIFKINTMLQINTPFNYIRYTQIDKHQHSVSSSIASGLLLSSNFSYMTRNINQTFVSRGLYVCIWHAIDCNINRLCSRKWASFVYACLHKRSLMHALRYT